MAIIFTQSAYRHFAEDNLDEESVRQSMTRPIWFALVDPEDTSVPPKKTSKPSALIICLRHLGALEDDLIKLLARPDGRHMMVYHVEHLTDKWRNYWQKWK